MMPLRRFSTKRPGWDCIRKPCGKNGCGTNPGSNHGIHGEEWTYAVSDGQVALSLSVITPLYPSTVPRAIAESSQYSGGLMHLHVAWRVDDDDIRTLKNPAACEFLSERQCFAGGTFGMMASDFWKQHGRPTFEQSDAFWIALEEKLRDLGRDVLDQRTKRRCPVCDGSGIIKHHAGST